MRPGHTGLVTDDSAAAPLIAVDDPDRPVAEVAQQPPGAGGGGGVGVVIDDDQAVVAHAGPAHRRREVVGRRHRMASADARRGGQLEVEVHEGGTGNVPGLV